MDPVIVQRPGPTTGDDGDATGVGFGTIEIEARGDASLDAGPTGAWMAAGVGEVSEPHAAVASINDTTTTGSTFLEMA